MDQSTANDYIEDLLEERAMLLEEIRSLKDELMRVSLSYVDTLLERNIHIIDKVQE